MKQKKQVVRLTRADRLARAGLAEQIYVTAQFLFDTAEGLQRSAAKLMQSYRSLGMEAYYRPQK